MLVWDAMWRLAGDGKVDTPIRGWVVWRPGKKVSDFYFRLWSICRNGVRRIIYSSAHTLFLEFLDLSLKFSTYILCLELGKMELWGN